ncbi:unnamed protein product, partial [Phaeothamnion confervicola]
MIISTIIYAIVWKFPVPCYGCDSGGIFYRCINGTGENTRSCEAYTLGEKRVKKATGFISGVVEDAGDFLEELWTFTKEDLPPIVYDFIQRLKELIMTAKAQVTEKMHYAIKYLTEAIPKLVAQAKALIGKGWEEFREVALDPVIAFVLTHIVSPLVAIAEALADFRNLVWGSISDAVGKFANLNLGGFASDVVDLFAQIPASVEWMKENLIKVINLVKNKSIDILNTGINASLDGIETAVNALGGGVDAATGGVVDGLNTIKNGIIDGMNTSFEKVTSGISTSINKTSSGIETSINKSVAGVQKGVDAITGVVDNVVPAVAKAVNTMGNTVETSLNQTIDFTNTALGKINTGVNTVVNSTESIVNDNISKVNSIVSLINDLRDVEIFGKTPFNNYSWWPKISGVSKLSIDPIDAGTIQTVTIQDVSTSGNIGKVTIPTVSIPTVSLVAPAVPNPTDIQKVSVGTVDLPQDVIPNPEDVTVADVDNVLETVVDKIPDGALSALTWIPSKISELKTVIANLFESAMEPVYASLVTIYSAIKSIFASVIAFFSTYLTLTAIRERISMLFSLGRKLVVEDLVQGIIMGELVPGFISILESIKEPVTEFVGKAAHRLWDFLGLVGNGVSKLFGEVYKAVMKVTTLVAKNVIAVVYYSFGTGVDRLTYFLPVDVTIKIIVMITLIVYILIGDVFGRVWNIFALGKDAVALALQAAVYGINKVDHSLDI